MRLISHVGRAIRKSGQNTTEFARESGISRSTLEKLIGNHFSEVRRDTIERLATRLKIQDLSELFSLQEDSDDFLGPYTGRNSVTFVFGTHDVKDAGPRKPESGDVGPLRTTVDLWDFRTQTEFLSFLRQHQPEIRDELQFFSKANFGPQERQEVVELVRKHNVVIVGSPKVNPACEAVLQALYRVGQRGTQRKSPGPRLRLADDERLKDSILAATGFTETGVVDSDTGRMLGTCRFDGAGKVSQDAGILFTVYRPLGTAEEVSLVIAAGVSGCGTYGALRSLVENPPQREDLVPGVVLERAVQTLYKKPTPSPRDDRQIMKVASLP